MNMGHKGWVGGVLGQTNTFGDLWAQEVKYVITVANGHAINILVAQ